VANRIETRNARVVSTFIGKEDHGIPTCSVRLDYGGSVQSFGGWDLRHYGYAMIQGILDAVGAESWETLQGMHVRARCESTKIYALGHIIEDRWYAPEEARP